MDLIKWIILAAAIIGWWRWSIHVDEPSADLDRRLGNYDQPVLPFLPFICLMVFLLIWLNIFF